jgi:hypothetical protein
MNKRIGLLLVLLATAVTPRLATAQDATLSGRVLDSSGAAVPAAAVSLASDATRLTAGTVTNGEGVFRFTSQRPGAYSLAVALPGFSSVRLDGIRLEVGDNRTVKIELQPSQQQESVTVTAEETPLSLVRADRSVVVEHEFVTSIPLNIRNPLAMINNAVGVTPASASSGSNVASQSQTNTFRINGAKASTTDILLDGAANTTAYANQAAAIPQVDAIEEFRVLTSAYAPEYGRTSGGMALFGLRSGTNRFRGTMHEFLRNEALDANGFNANRAQQPRPNLSRNQYGFTLGGPIAVPRLYDGHDHTFLFVAYEGLRENRAGSFTGTVPTALERDGDFSQTRDEKGALIVVYDPRTTRLDPDRPAGTTRYIRDPFPGNRIPLEMQDPVGRKILSYYPLPNQEGQGRSQTNNYFSNEPNKLNTDRVDVRLDHTFSARHQAMFRLNYFQNLIFNPDVYHNGFSPVTANNRLPGLNVMARHSWFVSPSVAFEHHFSWAKSQSNRTSPSLGFDPTSLGFPASAVAGNDTTTFPLVTATRLSGIGGNVAFERNGSQVLQYEGKLSWQHGRHLLKAGLDLRAYPVKLYSATQLTVRATSNFTGGPNPQAAGATSGHGAADLLLGAASVSNGVVEYDWINHPYYAAFVQDELRATSRLTLTYGLRYNLEPAWSERSNHLVYLDLDAPSPIRDQVAGFPDLHGGVGFVGQNGLGSRSQAAQKLNFDPRVGAAYQWNEKTVVHGGFGVFHHGSPSYLGVNTSVGSSRLTSSVVTEADTVTPLFNLGNPFPQGLLAPIGSSQGLSTLLGQNVTGALRDQKVSYQVTWSADVQRQLPSGLVVTIGYAGSLGRDLLSAVNLNQLSDDQLALGSALLQPVPNPFYGVITDPTSLLSRSTVQRGQLLRPYPQFQNVTAALAGVGRSSYHALQATLERRFSKGFGTVIAYTHSKMIDNVGEVGSWAGDVQGFQNNNCFSCDRSLSMQDVPDVVRWTLRYDLPFGHGHALLTRGPLSQVLGGWALAGFFTWDNGTPVRLTSPNNSNSFGGGIGMRPNAVPGVSPVLDGGPQLVDGGAYFNAAAFERTPPFQFGSAPRTIPGVRNPGAKNLDLLIEKRFQMGSRVTLDVRTEVFNTFNGVQYAGPGTDVTSADFGRVFLRQVNTPRQIQFGTRLSF